jgi:protein-tyrosine phosphatase
VKPFNLRDVGGCRTGDGAIVRSGMIYRAASVHRCARADLPFARTLVDLRSSAELAREGACEPDGATVMHLPVLENVWGPDAYDADEPLEEFFADRYMDMLVTGRHALAGMLRKLGEPGSFPVVLFCAAGKDRTGVAAAVLLSLLDVPDEHVAADYALSAEPVRDMVDWLRGEAAWDSQAVAAADSPVLGAPKEAMLRFLALLRDAHGSAEGYARAIGVSGDEISSLRARLTVNRFTQSSDDLVSQPESTADIDVYFEK